MKNYQPSISAYTITKLRNQEKGAAKRGIEWDLTNEQIMRILARANGKCEVTGKPFVLSGDGREPWAPSLDRINSDKGYTFTNVRLVAVVVNYALHEFGDSVFFEMAEAAIQRRNEMLIERGITEEKELSNRPAFDSDARRLLNTALATIEGLAARISDLELRLNTGDALGTSASQVNVKQIRAVTVSEEVQLSTEDFADLNHVLPQTVLKQHSKTGHYFGIRPTKLPNRRLMWPAKVIQRQAA